MFGTFADYDPVECHPVILFQTEIYTLNKDFTETTVDHSVFYLCPDKRSFALNRISRRRRNGCLCLGISWSTEDFVSIPSPDEPYYQWWTVTGVWSRSFSTNDDRIRRRSQKINFVFD